MKKTSVIMQNSSRERDSQDMINKLQQKKLLLRDSTVILNNMIRRKSAQNLDRFYEELNEQQYQEQRLLPNQPSFGAFLQKQNQNNRHKEQEEFTNIQNLMPEYFNNKNNDIIFSSLEDTKQLESLVKSQKYKLNISTTKSIICFIRGNFEDSIKILNKGISLQEIDSLTYYCKGLCYYYLRQYLQALIQFNYCLKQSPELIDVIQKIQSSIQYHNELILLKLYDRFHEFMNKFEVQRLISSQITKENFQQFLQQWLPIIQKSKNIQNIMDLISFSMNIIDNIHKGRDICQKIYKICLNRYKYVSQIIEMEWHCISIVETLQFLDQLLDQENDNEDYFVLKAKILHQSCRYIKSIETCDFAFSRGIQNQELYLIKEMSRGKLLLIKDNMNFAILDQDISRFDWKQSLQQACIDLWLDSK